MDDKQLETMYKNLHHAMVELIAGKVNTPELRDFVIGLFHQVLVKNEVFQFKIRCDETNNPPQVIDSNGFNWQIIIRAKQTDEDYLFMSNKRMDRINNLNYEEPWNVD